MLADANRGGCCIQAVRAQLTRTFGARGNCHIHPGRSHAPDSSRQSPQPSPSDPCRTDRAISASNHTPIISPRRSAATERARSTLTGRSGVLQKLTVNERQTNQSCGHPHGWPIRPKPVVESSPNRAQSLDMPMSRDAAHSRNWRSQRVGGRLARCNCDLPDLKERRQDEIRYQLV